VFLRHSSTPRGGATGAAAGAAARAAAGAAARAAAGAAAGAAAAGRGALAVVVVVATAVEAMPVGCCIGIKAEVLCCLVGVMRGAQGSRSSRCVLPGPVGSITTNAFWRSVSSLGSLSSSSSGSPGMLVSSAGSSVGW
jgi:hypothetical protein